MLHADLTPESRRERQGILLLFGARGDEKEEKTVEWPDAAFVRSVHPLMSKRRKSQGLERGSWPRWITD